jgi:hypothetical protein
MDPFLNSPWNKEFNLEERLAIAEREAARTLGTWDRESSPASSADTAALLIKEHLEVCDICLQSLVGALNYVKGTFGPHVAPEMQAKFNEAEFAVCLRVLKARDSVSRSTSALTVLSSVATQELYKTPSNVAPNIGVKRPRVEQEEAQLSDTDSLHSLLCYDSETEAEVPTDNTEVPVVDDAADFDSDYECDPDAELAPDDYDSSNMDEA